MKNTVAEIAFPQVRWSENSASKSFLKAVAIAVAASGLVASCAQVNIPLLFTPVPLNLASLAALVSGLVLGPRLAFTSLCLYLLEGALGLPVFSPQGTLGILHLLGPAGGYLLSYPFAAAVAGYFYQRLSRASTFGAFVSAAASGAAASLLTLVFGATWLMLLTHLDIRLVLAQAVLPFLPGDVLKVFAAAGIATMVFRFRDPWWERLL
ncbi:Substrate-specific component BioY of biotin ECF transporter [Acidisarcina polymorpha]|uniref:Biotin transporter n=1 Tax=Acidisarcina polymorpha TaxID=2211140 RepID=A0A2Z5FS68_9BACT|nr:biotin transporter BioY [Acidisarcina polymorpha]AXC09622.1 Substrate-specific component BioY of biotin ECF transporter [Acidisarcina polymorpha]